MDLTAARKKERKEQISYHLRITLVDHEAIESTSLQLEGEGEVSVDEERKKIKFGSKLTYFVSHAN
ncbi:hypothetical protein TSUD_162750 [Trifolium subterraneum]|uniref:Uncharacterized protein n=1 Tax=Trifolium subterraneum TaxID=3900 RepID=A0A2Z6NE68_TRISU|nr:hypothetical protein TSUD_162750 [Trifolium subterraneum]